MEDPKAPLKIALDRWAETTVKNSETRFRVLLTRAFLQMAKSSDRYSSWAMVGVAGAILAAVSNLKDIQSLVGDHSLRISLFLLIGSMAFGLLQKVAAAFIEMAMTVEIEAEKAALEVGASHDKTEDEILKMAENNGLSVNTDIDFGRVMQDYLDLFPRPYRWLALRSSARVAADPKHMHRSLVRALFRQSWYVLLQVTFAILAVAVLATSL